MNLNIYEKGMARIHNWIMGTLTLLGVGLYTGCHPATAPTNQPPSVSITSNKQTAVAGDTVKFAVNASDDVSLGGSVKVNYGNGKDTSIAVSGASYSGTPHSFTRLQAVLPQQPPQQTMKANQVLDKF
jgi:hypothetical protein